MEARMHQATSSPPAIGDGWMGGIYAGEMRPGNGQANYLLVVLPQHPGQPVDWAAAAQWAEAVGAVLPTRSEAALVYAQLRDQMAWRWYWTGEEAAAETAYGQDFGFGSQGVSDKACLRRVLAVMRVIKV